MLPTQRAIEFHEVPVLTKTWFHTGAYLHNKKILDHFKDEYWYKDASFQDDLTNAGLAGPDKIRVAFPDAEFLGIFHR